MPFIPSEFPGVALSTLYGSTVGAGGDGAAHRSSSGHLCFVARIQVAGVSTTVLFESSDDGQTWLSNSIPLTGLHAGFASAGVGLAIAEKPDGTLVLVTRGYRTISSATSYFLLYNERDPGGSWGSWVDITTTLGTPSPYEGTTTYGALIDDNYKVYIATSYNTASLITNETGSWIRSQISALTMYTTHVAATQGGLLKFLDGTLLLSFIAGTSTNTRAKTLRRDPAGAWTMTVVSITGSNYGEARDLCVDIHRGLLGERLFVMVRGQTSAGMTRSSYVFVSDDKGYNGTQDIATAGNFTHSMIACSRYYLQMIGQPTDWPLKPYYYIVDESRAKVAAVARTAGPDDSCYDSITFTNYTLGGRDDAHAAWRAVVRSNRQLEHFPTGYGLYFSTGAPDVYQAPDDPRNRFSQFLLEIDVESIGASQISQFLLEVDIGRVLILPDISQFLIEVEDTGIDATPVQDDFLLAAKVTAPVTSSDHFALVAKVKPVAQHGGVFDLQALVTADLNQFVLQAKIKKTPPLLTEYYEDFDGPYEVRLLDHDGTLIRVLERFEHFEFTRAINGKYHSGYGSFQYLAAADLTRIDEFTLDRIIQVRRICTVGSPVVVFEGFVRYTSVTVGEDHKKMFICTGPDMKHLMKRRIIIPPGEEAFASFNYPFTDTMRYLVFQNASIFAPGDRAMYRVQPFIFDSYGIPLNLHYRYTRLSDELDQLANVEEGADWEVVQQYGVIYFKVHYLFKGKDRRRLSVQGWPEMIWSLDRGNVVSPTYVEDRLDEVTVTVVGGEGVGVDREIVVRSNIADRQFDSPWNRVEEFIDASSETSEASLKAQGDANNVEHGMVRSFTVQAAKAQMLTYGKKWNLGDICIGEFERGGVFDMRIVEVREVLDPAEGHLAVYPTFFVYPRLEDY